MINSPVVFVFYKKVDTTIKAFEKIREVKPRVLYLFSDGPKANDDKSVILALRNTISNLVDWNCEIYENYLETNVGVWGIYKYALDIVFNKEDRLIYLEDDIVASNSFFRFCDELLERYYYSDQIYMIGGMSGLKPTSEKNSYFYTPFASPWGHALWKRTYLNFPTDLSFLDDEYYLRLVKNSFIHNGRYSWYKSVIYNWKNPQNVINNGMEFYLMGLNDFILNNAIAILPSVNLVKNIGAVDGAEHSDDLKLLPRSMRRLYEMEIYELEFPLIHPKYRIIDHDYLRKSYPKKRFRIISLFFVKLERVTRILVYGGPSKFINKLSSKFNSINHEIKKNLLARRYKK
jgi:hypothetical protein